MEATATYQAFARFYDQYVHGFTEDLPFYAALCQPNGRIVEIGCGTGRVLQRLINDGFTVTGVDISPEMLAVAQQKLSAAVERGALRLLRHDMLDAPLAEHYDIALVTFYTFNYILDQPERFLRNIFQSMTAGARLVMDLFYPRTLFQPELDGVWTTQTLPYQGKEVILRDQRTVVNNRETRIQIYTFDGQETRIETVRRYFPPEEIRQLLVKVGFQEIQLGIGYDARGLVTDLAEGQLRQNFVVTAIKKM
jgi:SAM-dependent methyltransferase